MEEPTNEETNYRVEHDANTAGQFSNHAEHFEEEGQQEVADSFKTAAENFANNAADRQGNQA